MCSPLAAAFLGLAAGLVLAAPAPAGDDAGGKGPRAGSTATADKGGKDWSKHTGDIPFIIGREAGLKEVEFTGKPILFFYTATWWHFCEVLAGSAFKDAEVVKLAQKFVPVLVDGDVDKDFGKDYGVSGFPNTVLADPKGKKISFFVGAVPTGTVVDQLKSALKKIGPVQVKKQVKELEEASAALAKAREKSDWKAVLKAAATIEKINHDGPALVDARKAKADAEEESKKRLDAAKGLIKDGKAEEAKSALGKIASTFEGLDAAVEAKNLLKELAGPAEPKDGGGDDGGGQKKGKK